MAQESKHKGRKDEESDAGDESDADEGELSSHGESEGEGSEGGESERGESDRGTETAEAEASGTSESLRVADDQALGRSEDGDEAVEGEGDEEHAAAQLGSDRYVLAGFFAAAMLGAYVLGRAIQGLWISASNKDWFAQSLPRLAAVGDDDKATYGIILGGIVAAFVVYRTYKRPDVRQWSDDVASELAKVVWPSRKEVTSSTFIVIVASAAATIYLALLDRLWAFVTNIVYGDGS
jgi:preprotein translocase subunit SecE